MPKAKASKKTEKEKEKKVEKIEEPKTEPKIEKESAEIVSDEETEKFEWPKTDRYFEAVGRRKTAVARVRIFTKGEKQVLINNKPYQQYFLTPELQQIVLAAFKKMKCLDYFGATARVKGGGIHSQAEAIRHGMAQALVKFNESFRKKLRKAGFLTRDPRMRERKKFGLKRARRAPQWQKR